MTTGFCLACGMPTRLGNFYTGEVVHAHSGLKMCDTVASSTVEPTFHGPIFDDKAKKLIEEFKFGLDTHRAAAFGRCNESCFCWDIERWLFMTQNNDLS